jgi:hypothetical protein
MDGEGRNLGRSARWRRNLVLGAVLAAVACAAVVAVPLGPRAAGGPHHLTTRLVQCRSTIIVADQNGPPPEITGRPVVRLPGGGWVACGQLVEEPGGSQPYAVVVSAGSFGLSATIPGVPVGTEDFTTHRIGNIARLTRMRFLAGREYLLSLESDPNDAYMTVYTFNGIIKLHLVF